MLSKSLVAVIGKKGAITQAGTNWMKQHYPETTTDKQLEYELLAASDADWTLVSLPLIWLTESSGPIVRASRIVRGQASTRQTSPASSLTSSEIDSISGNRPFWPTRRNPPPILS